MQVVTKQEMQEFQTLAQTTMLQNPSCYSFLDAGIEKYVSEMWQVNIIFLKPLQYKYLMRIKHISGPVIETE